MRLGRNKLTLVALISMMALAACGCASQPQVQQPQLTASQQDLTEAAQRFLPQGAKITTPLTSLARPASAYLTADIDADGSDEAVVLYRNDASVKVGALFLRNVKGSWQQTGVIEEPGHDVVLADFANLFSSGAPAFLFGVSVSADQSSQLTICRWQDSQEQQLTQQTFRQISVGDANGDGRAEVVTSDLTSLGQDKGPATAVKVIAAGANSINVIGQDTIDGYPYAALVGNAAANKPGIFIETVIGAHTGMTELLFVGPDGLTRAFPDPYAVAFKAYPLASVDADNDGTIEIGGMLQPPGTEDLPMAGIPWIQTWQRWDGAHGLGPVVLERYADNNVGYRFDIPAKWVGKFTVSRSTDPLTQTEFSYVDAAGRPLAPLLTIRRYAASAWGDAEKTLRQSKTEYAVLAQPGDQVLVAILPGDSTALTGAATGEYQGLRISPTQVAQLFRTVPN